ncbi:STAS domain-containing protein [Polymorphospora lycopeni]|uniref:Anti-sigma factor antagonist n=1 Tax=Polymorphospora lycopeni TaxID=3140240 RepID=A0ABV5CMI1_9ACTN
MALDVRTESAGDGRVVVRVRGYVDLETEERLGQELTTALSRPGVTEVTVDLAEVPFLDSSGVRVLLDGRSTALARGAALAVRDPQPVVDRVLRITGVAELLGLPPDGDGPGARIAPA